MDDDGNSCRKGETTRMEKMHVDFCFLTRCAERSCFGFFFFFFLLYFQIIGCLRNLGVKRTSISVT